MAGEEGSLFSLIRFLPHDKVFEKGLTNHPDASRGDFRSEILEVGGFGEIVFFYSQGRPNLLGLSADI